MQNASTQWILRSAGHRKQTFSNDLKENGQQYFCPFTMIQEVNHTLIAKKLKDWPKQRAQVLDIVKK
jgi:hypothetical protein